MANNQKLSILEKVTRVIATVSNGILYFCIITMAIMTVADVLLRYFADIGIGGIAEASTYLLVLVGFLGIARTQALEGHISVTFLTDRFSPSVKYYVQQGVGGVLILFSSLFVYASTLKALSAFVTREGDWFGTHILPTWPFRLAVPIGFCCVILEVLIDILEMKSNRRKQKEMKSDRQEMPL
jgi:TRAP-type transport system small permease protein